MAKDPMDAYWERETERGEQQDAFLRENKLGGYRDESESNMIDKGLDDDDDDDEYDSELEDDEEDSELDEEPDELDEAEAEIEDEKPSEEDEAVDALLGKKPKPG